MVKTTTEPDRQKPDDSALERQVLELHQRVSELEDVMTQVLAGMIKQLNFDQTLAARMTAISKTVKDRDSQFENGD